MGVSGSKDFIWEQALFSYRFKSSNRHAFTIRTHHIGMTTGNLTGHASIRRELGNKWALYVVIWQCFVAWLGAFIVRLIGLALGMG